MTAPPHHIVVCDDETELREMVCEYLERRGYRVTPARDTAQLSELIETEADIDLVLLDIAMPGEDGLSALKRIGTDRSFAVIMLTAADHVVDRIVGLELGADDYMGKPVELRELEARIKSVMRRFGSAGSQHNAQPDKGAPTSDTRRFGGFTLDLNRAILLQSDGSQVTLTAMEYRLLTVFVEHKGRVLSRDQLLELAHDRRWDPFDRSIDIRISRLRRKIETTPDKPSMIRTVRGIGYVFDPKD
ncbi:MAG: winged helix-turn-helix domain-containing protein [Pseudomonadota bacterium]